MMRRRSGFTLIELLVVVALLTVVVGLLMYPLLGGFTFLSKGKARHEANAATRFAMDVMTRELSNAIDVLLVSDQHIVFVLPNMRTYCRAGGHWLKDAQGRDYYSYYCPQHHSGDVEHQLIEPTSPMRNAEGRRVAIVYYIPSTASQAAATQSYLARAVVPFPEGSRLQDWSAWRALLAQITPAALTPTGEDFSIERLRFAPTAVKNEALTPYWRGRQSDYSIYRARYPLWQPSGNSYSIDVRAADGTPVVVPRNVDARSGTVSFAQERQSFYDHAAYLVDLTLLPPVLGPYGPIVPDTEVVIGPNGSAFVRAGVTGDDQPPALGEQPREGEYWIDYQRGRIYVNSVYAGNNPPRFNVSYMRHDIDSSYSVMASYETYALLNIDLTVRKREAESGKAGPEGVLGQYQDFHISGKAKLLNVWR